MKSKLLKKVRRKVKLYERNGDYYVDLGNYNPGPMDKERALSYYRFWIIKNAKIIFGFKSKTRIL